MYAANEIQPTGLSSPALLKNYKAIWTKETYYKGILHWLQIAIGYRFDRNIDFVRNIVCYCRAKFEQACATTMAKKGLPKMLHPHFYAFVDAVSKSPANSAFEICREDNPDPTEACGQCIRVVRVITLRTYCFIYKLKTCTGYLQF
jgi:hypothetical protein